MSILYITEYAELHIGAAGRIGQLGMEPPLAEQTVAIGGGHAESQPLNAATRLVRLHCDAVCSVLIGPAGSVAATTASGRMAINQTEFRGIPPGSNLAVSVVSNV